MKQFLKSCLSEPDGTVSFGRCASGFIMTAILSWDTAYIVFAMKHYGGQPVLGILPDAGTLAAQGVFMTLFYAANKTASVMGSKSN